jgi:hypothetical protein
MVQFKGAIKRVKRVELPGQVVVIDGPRESPLMTWQSRYEKAWDWTYDVPIWGDLKRHQARRQWVHSARGGLWVTAVGAGLYGAFALYSGALAVGLVMCVAAGVAGLFLAWPSLCRGQIEVGPQGWLVRHTAPWGTRVVARGGLQELGSFEIERLDTRQIREADSMADDRVCLYVDHLGGKAMLSSGLSSIEAEWVVRQVDEAAAGAERALPGPTGPRALT